LNVARVALPIIMTLVVREMAKRFADVCWIAEGSRILPI